ncbi:MAG: thioesterase family protein [Acidimicrobiales bacterium]
MTVLDAFYDRHSDGSLVPRPAARSPWSADMMHGRLLAGLAAREVEHTHLDEGLHPVRLTIDLFRSPAMEPVRCTSAVLRAGRRLKVVEVVQTVGDTEVARAVVVMMRTGDHPDTDVWSPDPWDVPDPDTIEVGPESPMRQLTSMDVRPVDGRGMGSPGRRQVWLRDHLDLVDGESLTPFQRAAIASDFASPLANSSPDGLRFINGDITLSLARLPVDPWIGIEVGSHIGHAGIAIARCDLYDREGPIGFVDVSAVATAPINAPTTDES